MTETKDWSWAQHRRCDECGFDASAEVDVVARLVDVAARWSEGLQGWPADAVRVRGSTGATSWSALEYGGHVRDLLGVFAERIERVAREERPDLGWWDHEAAALDERYNEQAPNGVASRLVENADRLARQYLSVPPNDRDRVGTRRGVEFTIDGLIRFAVHESVHHYDDAHRMMPHHLAQLNVGRLLAPIDDPLIADFAAALDPVNARADVAPGFVWRLQTDDGNATSVRAFDDPYLLLNMSVWESVESSRAFVQDPAHLAIMRRRREFFEAHIDPYVAMWWVPAGVIPTEADASERLQHRIEHGPTPFAFDFRHLFEPVDLARHVRR